MPNKVSKHIILNGRVQGVSYRNWMVEQADKLGVSGWVRNVQDGTVEAVIAGSQESVENLLEACYQGPARAEVRQIQVETSSEQPSGSFKRRPTL